MTEHARKQGRIAVVLFNLGGPDSLYAVQPFLKNLFSDPAIIRLPGFLRKPLAWLIARRRREVATEIYSKMGGRSPIYHQTEAQAAALGDTLERADIGDVGIFVAMRYWFPNAASSVKRMREFGAQRVILLPLYPQFSTTTTGSSIKEWKQVAASAGGFEAVSEICCYPDDDGFIDGYAELIATELKNLESDAPVKLILSAHGLPQKIVDAGDPYAWQVGLSAEAVAARLAERFGFVDLDYEVAYQSRVGPLKWLEPATDRVIIEAARAGKAIVVAPIAFVSEHSETLVELDIDYRKLAEEAGAAAYARVPAIGTHPSFIEGLAQKVVSALAEDWDCRAGGAALCPSEWRDCYCRQEAAE